MPHRSPVRRIGRRGLVLIFVGMIWILYGIAYLKYPLARFTVDDNVPGIANAVLTFFSSSWIGYIWLLCGLAAVAFGLARSRISLISWDHYGFNAILIPPIIWTFLFLWSWVASLTSNGNIGAPLAVFGFVTWLLATGFILIIAGWPDPSDLPPARLVEKAGESL